MSLYLTLWCDIQEIGNCHSYHCVNLISQKTVLAEFIEPNTYIYLSYNFIAITKCGICSKKSYWKVRASGKGRWFWITSLVNPVISKLKHNRSLKAAVLGPVLLPTLVIHISKLILTPVFFLYWNWWFTLFALNPLVRSQKALSHEWEIQQVKICIFCCTGLNLERNVNTWVWRLHVISTVQELKKSINYQSSLPSELWIQVQIFQEMCVASCRGRKSILDACITETKNIYITMQVQ